MNADCSPVKIIIADDHPLCLSGFKRMLDLPGFQLLAEADNGEDLIQLALQLIPDIIITDIKMPRMDGIEATKRIIKKLPGTGVIALSIVNESGLIIDMLDAGAKGYLLKNAPQEEIIAAVNAVHKGETYYCKNTTLQLAKMMAGANREAIQKDAKNQLSDTEINIIKLICKGHSNKEIARDLNLNKRQVEWHRGQILKKTNAKNTACIVTYAIKNKIYIS